MTKSNDPTDPIRKMASEFENVDEGTACTQSSFKTGGKSFLFIGMQGGRYKAMFKLDQSIEQATKLSEKSPEDFQVGSTQWVTARFSAEKPLPIRLWKKWLKESYQLSQKKTATKKNAATKKKTAAKKKPSLKKKATTQGKTASKKKAAAKKKRSTKKKS